MINPIYRDILGKITNRFSRIILLDNFFEQFLGAIVDEKTISEKISGASTNRLILQPNNLVVTLEYRFSYSAPRSVPSLGRCSATVLIQCLETKPYPEYSFKTTWLFSRCSCKSRGGFNSSSHYVY